MEFGVIPRDHWNQPDWIDETKASASRRKMQLENIIYGGSYNCPLYILIPLIYFKL